MDWELDDILQTGDDIDYVDISLITKETARPNDAIASNTFIPELDRDTTMKVVGLSRNYIVDIDEKSIFSCTTLDSRMSKMENNFSSIC